MLIFSFSHNFKYFSNKKAPHYCGDNTLNGTRWRMGRRYIGFIFCPGALRGSLKKGGVIPPGRRNCKSRAGAKVIADQSIILGRFFAAS